MLNRATDDRRIGIESQWCVGEPPARWDVCFGQRLAEKIRQLLWRERVAPIRNVVLKQQSSEPVRMRKAA
jgi:hypothetical protein